MANKIKTAARDTEIFDINSAKLQFVSWIVLFISTALIQFADFRIGSYQSLVNRKLLLSSNTIQVHLGEELKTQTSTFLQYIQFDNRSTESLIDIIVQDNKANFLHSPEIDAIIERLKNKEISLKDYFTSMLRIHKKKAGEYLNNYNKSILEINNLLKKGTIWEPI